MANLFVVTYRWMAVISLVYAACLPEPVVMLIGNVPLSPFGTNRGAQLGVGGSPQHFALDASIAFNNTYVWERCGYQILAEPVCYALEGGVFSRDSSATFKPAPDVQSAGGSVDDNSTVLGAMYTSWGADSFVLNPSVTLEQMPVGLIQVASPTIPGWVRTTQGFIGLGPNSTVLNALTASGHIGSHVWSYYYGLTGDAKEEFTDYPGNEVQEIASNGSLVLGGYDVAKVRGPNGTYPITNDPACPPNQPSLVIADIIVGLGPNQTSLLNSSSPVTACIDTTFAGLMAVPGSLYSIWRNVTGFNGANYDLGDSNKIDAGIPGLYSGSLSVKMSDGLLIDGLEINQPTWNISDSGELFGNASAPWNLFVPNINQFQPKTITIGRKFFNTVYIMFNPKKGEFTLWNAHDTDQQQLIPVGDDGILATACSSSTGASDGSGGAAAASAGAGSSRLSGGAIAGIAVGSVAGVAIVCVVAVAILYRRKRRATNATPITSGWRSRPAEAELPSKSPPMELLVEPKSIDAELPAGVHGSVAHELEGQDAWIREMH